MKILFCIYKLDYADHISISYLSAVAKKRGHNTYFCILENFAELLEKIKPDMVAFSLNIYGFESVVSEHKKYKDIYKYISIAGGPQCTFSPELFNTTGFDVYCIGEGELAFDDFLSCIESGKSYDNVQNLITPSATNPVRPWIKDLDTLPFPDRDLILSNSFLKDVVKKTFYTTRGCPFTCNYCANNYYSELYKGKGKIFRRFSPERVIEEIEYVGNRYRMEFIKFGDDLFALKADTWLKDFSRLYKEKINIPFNCYLRFDTVSEELLQLLKDCNCHSVHLSVDSVSEHVREKILGRKMRRVNIEQNLKLIHSYGIETWVNFMLAAPESTVDDDLATIELSRTCNITYTAYATTVPMKGTKLYDYTIEHGLISNQYISDMTGCSERSELSCFSEKEKDIRYNIFLLGAIAAKLPFIFSKFVVFLIKHTKPNKFYTFLRKLYYNYNIKNKIFQIGED